MLDLFPAGIIGQAASDAQSSNDAALIGFDMEDAQACAPSGSRLARPESTGREGQPLVLAGLGLTLTMARALGVLA